MQAIGSDALFSLMIVTRKVDRKYGTNYYDRVMKYYEYVVGNDLAIAVAQTDVKGNMAKRPHEQEDKDMYLSAVPANARGLKFIVRPVLDMMVIQTRLTQRVI